MTWVLRKRGGEAITIDREVSIGRDPGCTIRIKAPAVSRVHCRLRPSNDHVILTDEGRNGTLVNGIRVGKVAHVGVGDVIEVDTEHFQIQRTAASSQQETQNLNLLPKEVANKKVSSQTPRMDQAPVVTPQRGVPTAEQPARLPPTVFPPPPPAETGSNPNFDAAVVPTTEVSAARMREQEGPVPFEVEVVEDAAAGALRYRDAVRLVDEQALLIMTDFAGQQALTSELTTRWKSVVRKAGAKGKTPDAVLEILNHELFEAKLQATATCARLNVRERLVAVACAGTAPPFIVRAGNRVVRVQATPTVGLGRVRAAQFTERSLHFDRGDTLLVPSAGFVPPLEAIFSQPFTLNNLRAAEWLRQNRVQPPGASLLCLVLR